MMEENKESKLITKLSTYILILSGVILVLLGIIIYQNVPKNKLTPQEFVCGVITTEDSEAVQLDDAKQYNVALNYLTKDFNPKQGEKLFKSYCASCHFMSGKKLVGSGMEGLFNRVSNKKWLIVFMQNTDSVLHANNGYSKLLLEKSQMENMENHPFAKLNDEELINLLGYIGMK